MGSDRAASAWFVGLGLLAIPVLVIVGPLRGLQWLLAAAVIAGAVWLALAGVLMAWGLTAAMRRGDDLDDDWWTSMLDIRPTRPAPPGRPLQSTRERQSL
jgi:hypothetical protein